MDKEIRRFLARRALAGYVHGPEAATVATKIAVSGVGEATRCIVLVEGISDQIAVETLAKERGRDFREEGIVVVPAGGVHGMARFLHEYGPYGAELRIAGFCDAKEEKVLMRSISSAGIGHPASRTEMWRMGFGVCVEDLEDELIRAVGAERTEALFESQGDRGSFRRMQMQPAWRDQPIEAQMRRFLSSGARRKLRYSHLLVKALSTNEAPEPLETVLSLSAD